MLSFIALAVILVCPSVFGTPSCNDVGDGDVCKLGVLADSWIENEATNHDSDTFLSIGYLHSTKPKRALLKFDTPTSSSVCAVDKIRWAKMYLHYNGVHRDTESVTNEKEFSYSLQVHPLKVQWTEDEVTGIKRSNDNNWGTVMVGIANGVDAKIDPQDCTTTVFASRPNGFVELDVTRFVRALVGGATNNGVIVYAINEAKPNGVDIQFTSDEGTSSKQAFINVMCNK